MRGGGYKKYGNNQAGLQDLATAGGPPSKRPLALQNFLTGGAPYKNRVDMAVKLAPHGNAKLDYS